MDFQHIFEFNMLTFLTKEHVCIISTDERLTKWENENKNLCILRYLSWVTPGGVPDTTFIFPVHTKLVDQASAKIMADHLSLICQKYKPISILKTHSKN